MQSIILNFQNPQLFEKVLWLLKHFEEDGLEIVVEDETTKEFCKLSEKSLNNVWDNAEDSEYDRL
ncbi:MAG: hypothetical protein M0P91_10210 [Sulfuricurvum sp.]|jgi:hypothetical protein|uniref:hypothetical protein n=1 Tax=Sulfuricurvum sp. TaxID=2025608 RepID=UPI0025EAF932|nr:hypothetical protein [Sulfuricurvum sp.]MCK9373561.1 hypothetical protein [Sulfuricurvum sp.]